MKLDSSAGGSCGGEVSSQSWIAEVVGKARKC